MSLILANIKYLLAPVLILVTFAGVLAGGLFAWLGVALTICWNRDRYCNEKTSIKRDAFE